MAIPFNLPSDQETYENYRSMDDLLLQLYTVLRQILIRRAPVPAPMPEPEQHRHGRVPRPHAEEEVDAAVAAPSLPDVVCLPLPTPGSQVAPVPTPPHGNRRRRRRRRQDVAAPPKKLVVGEEETTHTVRDNWTQVGDDLRQIADEFSTSLQDIDPTRLETSPNQKGLNLLSLLVPPPFRGSIWLAMVFLFGWGALRAR